MIPGVFILSKMASTSLPGDFIYPIKGIEENWRLEQSPFGFKGRAETYLDMTQSRLTEVEGLIEQGSEDKVIIATIRRLLETQANAINEMNRAQGRGESLRTHYAKLESILQKEQNDLPKLIFNVSQPVSEELQKVIEQSYVDSEALSSIRR